MITCAIIERKWRQVEAAIDNIDLFIGGLAEKHAPGAPGRSDVQAIIKNQFDVFWQGDGGGRWLGFVLDSSCLWHDHGVNEENDIWPVLWALWTF
jgi:hypothetical protein